MNVSLGLVDPDPNYIMMNEWNCTILGGQGTPVEFRIISLRVSAGQNYPAEPPNVRFLTKVNLSCVGGNGVVAPAKLKEFWKGAMATYQQGRGGPIENLLLSLRGEFSRERSKAQPPEGTMY